MKQLCGGCNMQGDSRRGKLGSETFCLYDDLWHPSNQSCSRWVKYSHNLSKSDRIQVAMNLKRGEDDERRHQEKLSSSEKDRALEVKKMICSFLLGILATLIAQGVISLWK